MHTPLRMLPLTLLFAALCFTCGCETMLSQAKGAVTNVQITPDVGVIDDKPDAGYNVSFVLTNRGSAGMINIRPWLSCSEGNYTRNQDMQFAAGESRRLTYFFHEPTINATNVQGGVKVLPAFTQ